MRPTESTEDLIGSREDLRKSRQSLESLKENILTPTEKTFLLHAERGDCATVRRLIKEYKDRPEELNVNCVDPLDRSALISAIENENIDLIKLLLEENIKVKDALLHAIKEEYVEAVELLLEWEEQHHVSGQPYSWEAVDRSSSTFTPDITPLILAAHKNNYEIIKLLLDRGATLPMPHDVKCGCDECVVSSEDDSLRHSQSRINAYRALSSSSLIALSSKDPLLTAFELSWELRRLSRMETEFRVEYNEMRTQTQNFATSLLDHARTSHELEIMLNFNQNGDHWEPGERQTLERLKLAIKYKQKMFVAHPNVQQLLAAIWYDGLPGFRRKTMVGQLLQVAQLAAMFPVYSSIYMIAPTSNMGQLIKKPFVKFICHSASYAFFLSLLGLASQRAEILVLEWFGTPWMRAMVEDWKIKERGAGPGFAECGCILYVISLIWGEIRSLWTGGLAEYIEDLWNIVDCCTNFFFMSWITLRMFSWYTVQRDVSIGKNPWYPREKWDPYDPMLLSEGAFAAGMIFSFLKLVHIFSVNPHLGPLQISLGRMIIDIIKFFFIYTLVLSAFGCGLNQLLWYYANIEKNKCYHTPDGLPDFENFDKACEIWRRYANLFETSQTLFWASFGLVDLMNFELTGIKEFTRFWALLMFGSYSVINIIVLLNMLIAMMSNSYQIISERADSEWKFARSNLWMSYFEEGDTLPAPFNIMPTPKIMMKCFGIRKKNEKSKSFMDKSREKSEERHSAVMRLLIKRYVTAEQRKRDEFGITEDDVMEIRQDISSLRYELIDILAQNGMRTPKISQQDTTIPGKKGKVMERRLLKDFQIGTVEGIKNIINFEKESKDVFTQLAKVIGKRTTSNSKKDWNALVRQNTVVKDPIGSTSQSRQSLRKHIINASDVNLTEIDHNKLLEYNPKLSDVTLTTRLAYAKFMTPKLKHDYNADAKADGVSLKSDKQGASATKDVIANSVSTSPSVSIKEPNASKISDSQVIINERNLSAAPSVKRPPSPIMEEPPTAEVKIESETTSKSSSSGSKCPIPPSTQTETPTPQSKSPSPDMKSPISELKSQSPQSTILIPEIKSPPPQSKTHPPESEGSISDSKSPVSEGKSSVSESASKDEDSENKATTSSVPTCTVTIEAPTPIKKDGKSKVSGLPRVGWL